MLQVNTWLHWSLLRSRIKFFLCLLSFCGDEGLESIWPLALVHSFKNSDGLNKIPPYIEVVFEGNTSKMTNPNRFPIIRILLIEKFSNLFESGGDSSPSLPLRLAYQYTSYHLRFWPINLLLSPASTAQAPEFV